MLSVLGGGEDARQQREEEGVGQETDPKIRRCGGGPMGGDPGDDKGRGEPPVG